MKEHTKLMGIYFKYQDFRNLIPRSAVSKRKKVKGKSLELPIFPLPPSSVLTLHPLWQGG